MMGSPKKKRASAAKQAAKTPTIVSVGSIPATLVSPPAAPEPAKAAAPATAAPATASPATVAVSDVEHQLEQSLRKNALLEKLVQTLRSELLSSTVAHAAPSVVVSASASAAVAADAAGDEAAAASPLAAAAATTASQGAAEPAALHKQIGELQSQLQASLAEAATARMMASASSAQFQMLANQIVTMRLEYGSLLARFDEEQAKTVAAQATIAKLEREAEAASLELASAMASKEPAVPAPEPAVLPAVVAAPSEAFVSLLSRSKALEQLLQATTQQCASLQQDMEIKDDVCRKQSALIAEAEANMRNQAMEIQKRQMMLSEADQIMSRMRAEYSGVQDQISRAIALGKSRDATIEERDALLRRLETRMTETYRHALKVFWKRAVSTGSDIHRMEVDHWVKDSDAVKCHLDECGQQFGLVNRRHHCRRCGNIFCASHVSKRVKLSIATRSYHPDGVETKVCDVCAVEAHERAAQDSIDFESQLSGRAPVPMEL
ncbi:hypothetical protein BC831DRAFT_484308 [Entophlyctis helioformis]|nr:hypothetical protein BC831DRAFT_484308 [Entophlyctis helioformis]